MTNPIVSICCVTYNHAPFICKALDGFILQEPPTGISADEPWFEILIHDDASTDSTTDIIREYKAKHPNKIFPLYETENQYFQGHVADIDMYNYKRARGKYIAYCEGDDYWTDPHKLQKQVDFMERNPEYSVCFHCFRNYYVNKNEFVDTMPPRRLLQKNGNPEGMDIDMSLYFEDWYTQPMTMLFRVSMFDFGWQKRYKYYRDMHEIYHLIKAGKCRLMNFDGGVRNVHSGGIASAISRKKYCDMSRPMDGEFYWKTRNKYAKKQYIETLDECVREYAANDSVKALRSAIVRFLISGHPHSLIRNLKTIFGKK